MSVAKAVVTKKTAAKRTLSKESSRARIPSVSASESQLEPLALELFGVVRNALAKYGLTPAKQRRLFERTLRDSSVRGASGALLHQFRSLGELISTWFQEMPYVDATGKPRVLKIEGRGATFESLARQFLPEMPLAQVVDLACRYASIGTLPGGRIALYGDMMVNLARNSESALAETISHIKQIFGTCLHNVQTVDDAAAVGRSERLVYHVISAEDFEKFQVAIRPQIHDLCERVDRLLKSSVKRASRRRAKAGLAGIGIYVYYDGETQGDSNHDRDVIR
jgi:hypothetical protein